MKVEKQQGYILLEVVVLSVVVMAMAAIGLNSDIVKLARSGGKPILLGACCWAAITLVSLIMQHILGIW